MAFKSESCLGLSFLTYFRTRDKLNSLYDFINSNFPDCEGRSFMLYSISDAMIDLEFYFKPIPENGKSK